MEAMKFYYEGNLIRTSKTRVYSFALLNSLGKAVTCSANREACEREQRRSLNEHETRIKNYRNALEAQKAGKKNVQWTDSGKTFDLPLYRVGNLEKLPEWIENEKASIAIVQSWKVVELEARA